MAEARAMASLSHDDVAVLYEVARWRGTPLLVMEYLAGGTLAGRLREARVPDRRARRAGASARAHARPRARARPVPRRRQAEQHRLCRRTARPSCSTSGWRVRSSPGDAGSARGARAAGRHVGLPGAGSARRGRAGPAARLVGARRGAVRGAPRRAPLPARPLARRSRDRPGPGPVAAAPQPIRRATSGRSNACWRSTRPNVRPPRPSSPVSSRRWLDPPGTGAPRVRSALTHFKRGGCP